MRWQPVHPGPQRSHLEPHRGQLRPGGGHLGSQEGHLGSQEGHWCWKNRGNHWGSQGGHMELQGHRAQGCQFGPHRGKKWIKFKNHKGLAAWGCYVVKNSKIISFHLEFCVSNNWNCCQKFSLFFCRTWGTWGGGILSVHMSVHPPGSGYLETDSGHLLDRWAGRWMDGISPFCSTGHCPFLGPLPCLASAPQLMAEQGYCWPLDAFGRLVFISFDRFCLCPWHSAAM